MRSEKSCQQKRRITGEECNNDNGDGGGHKVPEKEYTFCCHDKENCGIMINKGRPAGRLYNIFNVLFMPGKRRRICIFPEHCQYSLATVDFYQESKIVFLFVRALFAEYFANSTRRRPISIAGGRKE